MKKLNKILIPIIGISGTIAMVTPFLVSCSKPEIDEDFQQIDFGSIKYENAMALQTAYDRYSQLFDLVNSNKTPEEISNQIDIFLPWLTATSSSVSANEIYTSKGGKLDIEIKEMLPWEKVYIDRNVTTNKKIEGNKLIIEFSKPILDLEQSFKVGSIVCFSTYVAISNWTKEECETKYKEVMTQLEEVKKYISTNDKILTITCKTAF